MIAGSEWYPDYLAIIHFNGNKEVLRKAYYWWFIPYNTYLYGMNHENDDYLYLTIFGKVD